MKRVLYISNIQTPYRESFFEKLSKECDLTVLYEREESVNRDISWSKNKYAYKKEFLSGITVREENAVDLRIIRYVLGDYDVIILGCYNSPVQIIASIILRILRKPFYFNLDGEIFLEEKNWRNKIKGFLLKGADHYLVGGEKAAISLRRVVSGKPITPYYFSSLSQNEIDVDKIKWGGGIARQPIMC